MFGTSNIVEMIRKS